MYFYIEFYNYYLKMEYISEAKTTISITFYSSHLSIILEYTHILQDDCATIQNIDL